jgi:hypothetical protein
MYFTSIEVVKTRENYFHVDWNLAPNPSASSSTSPSSSKSLSASVSQSSSVSPSASASESASASPSFAQGDVIDDIRFQIWWSRDPISGFLPVLDENGDPVEIDGAVGPLSYTHAVKQYDFNQDSYYKVLAIEKSDETNQFFSDTVFVGMYSDGVHETMRYAEDILYSFYHGEPCLIIKKKSFGARCPTCWSAERQQRVRTHCDTCKGSGYVTGYYQAIAEQVSFDSDPKKSDSQKEFENVFDTIRARLSNYPLVRPKDLIVNLDNNKRFVISHVETTKLPKLSELENSTKVLSKQNYIISQLLTLEELNPDDNEYFLDTANIPVVPITDEGRTGSTMPFFNDHRPVTVGLPLKINDGHQHVIFQYSSDDFQLISGIFTLKNTVGSIGTATYVAGEMLAPALKVVFVNDDGTVSPADCTDITQVDRVVGITLSEAAAGNRVVVQKMGQLTYEHWSWTVGKGIFFDQYGDLTQTAPSVGYWMNVAKVISPTTIEVLLRLPVILV